MSIAHRLTTWLGRAQASEKPKFSDLARKVVLESRLANIAECLERELQDRTNAGTPLANTAVTAL